MLLETGFTVYDSSVVEQDGTTYALVRTAAGDKALAVSGDVAGFAGEARESGSLVGPLTAANAAALRARLPWLRPSPLGLRTSAGFGDRLGIATPGHVQAVRRTGVAPIFAQQSVRENTRIGRTPQDVVDNATWGVFQTGWRDPWGADADHMKTLEDVEPFVRAGYTFFTVDPSAYVDDSAETADADTLRAKVDALPWGELDSTPDTMARQYRRTYDLSGLSLDFNERVLWKAAAKYGGAIAHSARMARRLRERMAAPFDLEISVDETETTTSLHEHLFIAAELRRLGVEWVSLAPRFVGRFEKGVDYIGDVGEFERNVAGHARIIRHFGSAYKLSLHTGSDKFSIYRAAVKHLDGLVHLKTAGTSYLEALRVVAHVEPGLFRAILDLGRERYEIDRKSYHVSAELSRVPPPAALADADLPGLLDQFDARQVLHVTFGSALDMFGQRLQRVLRAHEADYDAALKTHFTRHLAAFAREED